MKKPIIFFIVVILIILAGAFSVNFAFDKFVENISVNADPSEGNSLGVVGEKLITISEIKAIKESVSPIDKVKVINIVRSQFTFDEMKDLISLATDGLDQEELTYIKGLIKEKINSEDIVKLKEILNKYKVK